MIESILKAGKIDRLINATAAGTGDTLNGDILDLQGFDSVLLISAVGDCAATAVGTLKAYCGNAANLSDGAYKDTTATFTASASDADNKLLVLDVVRPGKRYVRADFVRATANIPVDAVIAIRYNAAALPVSQGVDVVHSALSVN